MKGILIRPKSTAVIPQPNKRNSSEDLVGSIYVNDLIEIVRVLNHKFPDDKVFYENDEFVIAIDGVILNSKELKNQYAAQSNADLIKKLFTAHGELFIKLLRGDLSLFLYEKKDRRWLIYANIIGTKPIYYLNNGASEELFISTNPYMLIQELKANHIKLTPNIESFYVAAAYNYLFSDMFFVNEIKKLEAGYYLEIRNGEKSVKPYFELSSFPQSHLSFEQSVDKVEELFVHAAKLQFEKDIEYNHNHLSTLSGGLDSRMTTLVGLENGYKSDTLTFSSKGYWDEIISKEVSKYHKLKNKCLNITSGDYLKEFDRSFEVDAGVVNFYLANQMFDLYESVDFSNYGLVHSGQVGDAILGTTLCETPYHVKYAPIYPSVSAYYREILEPILHKEMEKHASIEVTRFYNHVFNCTAKGNWIINEFTETSSPFTFEEVLKFGLSIPLEMRRNHKLYIRWIEKHHPDAGTFFYESTKMRTITYSNNRFLNKLNHHINLKLLKLRGLDNRSNKLLNFDKWGNSLDLKKYFDDSFYSITPMLNNDELIKTLIDQYDKGSFEQKLAAYNCVKSYHKIFIGS